MAHMRHLVAAVADPDRPVGGGTDHLARPLVVEDVEHVLCVKHRFVDEDPPELGLALGQDNRRMKSSSTFRYW